MWKRFFSSPAPVVDFVALDGHVLTVCSPQPLEGASVKVKVRQEERESLLQLRPSAVREVPGGYLYSGLVMEGRGALAPGKRALQSGEQGFLRGGDRLPYRVRVLSRDLTGFRALTLDLSPGGVQLESLGPAEVGRTVQVTLEPGGDTKALTLSGRVAWCQELRDGSARLGLEFLFLNEVQREAVKDLYRAVQERKSLSVSQLLATVHRQAASQEASSPVRTESRSVGGELKSYTMEQGDLKVRLGQQELCFGLLTGLKDLQGSAGTRVASMEYLRAGESWTYTLLSAKGQPVLEITCRTPPESV